MRHGRTFYRLTTLAVTGHRFSLEGAHITNASERAALLSVVDPEEPGFASKSMRWRRIRRMPGRGSAIARAALHTVAR